MRSDVETLSSALESIRDEVNQALKDLIESEIESGAGEVAVEAGRVLNAGGKRLRPILFLLAYQLAGGTNIDDVMPLALAFELIHTATLVHDDINDEAQQRRGIPTKLCASARASWIGLQLKGQSLRLSPRRLPAAC